MPEVQEKAAANERYHASQINDTVGKGEVDEKIIMKVTGAKELLKKNKHRHEGEAVNIFEILQMFRESHGAMDGRHDIGLDPFQQILMAASNADNDPEGMSDEDHDHLDNF